jgi:hypothetical protein
MGSDPFWPSYLANVNVLCVPAAATSSQRFAEVLDVLNTIQEVKVTDICIADGAQNGAWNVR